MNDLQDRKFILDGVSPQRILVKGSHFHILQAASKVKLTFDNRYSIERVQGQGGDTPRPYREVFISSEVPQTVVIALGDGRVRDNTVSINDANIAATVENANKNTHLATVTVPAGQTALLANGSASRKELRIQVDSEQPGAVFVGGLGLTSENGGLIEVGMVDYIQSEGAFYAHNPNADDVKVRLLSLERV